MENDNVNRVDLDQQMRMAYLDYAMSVIVSRALPDARDGLKPVHRRILFAMQDMGVRSTGPHKKSARIVLDVKKSFAADDWTTFSSSSGDGRIVVLDPGHGGSDAGAIGPTGVSEKSVSLAVSLKAHKLLTASGYRVVMTRTTDVDVAAPGVSDATELQARVDKAPPNTDLFISVHCNAFSNGKANGMETYHAPGAVKGQRLARLLNEELERLGGLGNRGVKAARFYVMTHSKCPASLIELGFITNPREEKLLASNDYQQKLAQAITNAVNRYFNQGGFDLS